MGIDLAALETFIAVAQLGSFSLAAQRLHVTQPSVTGRVQRLEAALGAKLLVRTTRRVEATPQGARLLAQAVGALSGLRAVVDEFRREARQARQRVVVAATPMLAALTLPPIIHAYTQRYTDVQVELRDLPTADVLAALDAGTADLAVMSFEGSDARFRVQPLRSDEMVVVVPAGHPLAGQRSVDVEQLVDCPLLVIEPYEPMRQRIADELKRRGLTPPPATKPVGNLNTLLGMLDAGMGATLMTRSMARRSSEAGHAVLEIEGLRLSRSFSLVFSTRAEPGSAVQSFGRFVHQAMSEQPWPPRPTDSPAL